MQSNFQMKNQKKKKVAVPIFYKLLPFLFPKLERFAPYLANKLAVYLFFTPMRFPPTKAEKAFRKKAIMKQYKYKDEILNYFVWGKGTKNIVVVHGWSSRPSHLRYIIDALVNEGFCVYAIEITGHGSSKKNQSNANEFGRCLVAFANTVNIPFEGIISHSIGGSGSMFALTQLGFQSPKLVSIASPTLANSILQVFADKIKSRNLAIPAIRAYTKKRTGDYFEAFTISEMCFKLPENTHWLAIHDENDKEAPVENIEFIKENFPKARVLITKGFGHNRILKSQEVIDEIKKFFN